MSERLQTLHNLETGRVNRNQSFIAAVVCFTVGFVAWIVGFRRGWTEEETLTVWMKLVTSAAWNQAETTGIWLNVLMWTAYLAGFSIIIPTLLQTWIDDWRLERVLVKQKTETSLNAPKA